MHNLLYDNIILLHIIEYRIIKSLIRNYDKMDETT